MSPIPMRPLRRIAGFGLFWTWNLLFVSFVSCGLAPFLLPELIRDLIRGNAPASFLGWLLGAIALPLAIAGLGLTRAYRSDPAKLLTLLFAVEAPLFLLALVRLFAVREASTGFSVVGFAVAASALVAFADLHRPAPERAAPLAAKLVGHAFGLMAALHLALWALFYAVPAASALVSFLFRASTWSDLFQSIQRTAGLALVALLLGTSLLTFSATLFAALPFALPWLHGSALRRTWASAAGRLGRNPASALAGAGALALVVSYALAAHQPQARAFELLAQTPGDDGERARLVAASGPIRDGLVNAYLSSYRYVGASGGDRHVAAMFESALGLSRESAQTLQDAYGLLGWPVRYQGESFEQDRQRAQALYESFFDQPIEAAEREAIRDAAASSFDRGSRETRLADVAAERVLLARQELVVEEHGDWAQVELHEVYENQTTAAQEVLYYFHLPETAVLTGLWLGDTDDRSKRFPFVVAPRGAAQAVYREEVQKRRDPALLEQVGPRQYRLRAFPIPAKPGDGNEASRMHLWMTWQALAENGAWPMPRLAERRNVFWNRRTERVLGGAKLADDGWLPAFVPPRAPLLGTRHQVTLPGGFVVTASPVDFEKVTVRPGLRAALVLDTSRSMERRVEELRAEKAWMQKALREAKVDLYLASAPSSGRGPERRADALSFNPDSIVWYGALTGPELLSQFQASRGEAEYDAVFVLTDGGGQDLVKEQPQVPALAEALWMVHLGGELPRAYDDQTNALLSRPGSGVATNLGEAVRRSSAAASMPGSMTDLAGGYLWTMEAAQAATSAGDPFAPLAGRQLILAMGRWAQGDALARLDAVHAVAREQRIVTPYSSMLVLVDDEQRRRLAQLEAQADRFEREVEPGTEGARSGSDLFDVSAVPEPHEWVLLSLAALMLVVASRWKQERRAGT
ncbi:MAG: TIGR02921 family PEP-CTERM protein [Myxococcales bacterium]